MLQRNIHYSTVLLRPLPRFSHLYTSVSFPGLSLLNLCSNSTQASAGSVQQPWFPTRPQHVLHINGFPQMGALDCHVADCYLINLLRRRRKTCARRDLCCTTHGAQATKDRSALITSPTTSQQLPTLVACTASDDRSATNTNTSPRATFSPRSAAISCASRLSHATPGTHIEKETRGTGA